MTLLRSATPIQTHGHLMTYGLQIIALLSGIVGGILYGLLFVGQKKILMFASANPHQQTRQKISSLLLTMLRIILLGMAWYFLLRSPAIPFILILVSFLAGFWLIIIKQKV